MKLYPWKGVTLKFLRMEQNERGTRWSVWAITCATCRTPFEIGGGIDDELPTIEPGRITRRCPACIHPS